MSKMDKLAKQGHQARLEGQPCEPPTTNPLERAAWEGGWETADADIARLRQILGYDKPINAGVN